MKPFYAEDTEKLKSKLLKVLKDNISLKKDKTPELFYEPQGWLESILGHLEKKYSRLSDWLPYMSYDSETKVYINNNGTKGMVFEVSPRLIAGDSGPIELMLDGVPEGVTLQIMLYGSPNITPTTDLFLANAKATEYDPMFKAIAEEFVGFLENRTKKSINKLMVTRIKNHRVFFTLTFDEKFDDIEIQSIAMTVRNILESKKFFPQIVNPQIFIPLLFEIFNMKHNFREMPGYDDTQFINEQVLAPDTEIKLEDDCVVSDGQYWGSLNVVQLPEYTHIYEFSKKLGDWMTMNVDKQQFFEPFFITTSYRRRTKNEINVQRSMGMATISQQLPGHIFTKLVEKQIDQVEANKKYDAKTPIFSMDMKVIISGSTKENLDINLDTVSSYWNSGNKESRFKVMQSKYVTFLDFLTALPMMRTKSWDKHLKSQKVLFYDECSHFAPMEADWSGTAKPTILCLSRRGQLVGFDLFDSQSAYNGYVVATTGAGKSVFINLLSISYLIQGKKVFIFDIGRSYEKLAKTIGGQWIEFNLDNPQSINPFSEIKTEKDLKEYADYLIDFIYFIGAPASLSLSEEIVYFVKSHIEQGLYELWAQYHEDLEVTHFSNWLLQKEDIRLQDFGQQLKPFTRNGRYGAFFIGKSTIDFSKPFVVMELDTVENMRQLLDAVLMIMMFHISKTIYLSGVSDSNYIVIMDEAHRFLGTSPNIDIFIEQAYRRFRKHNAAIIIATQGFTDIYNPKEQKLSKAGTTIFNTSAWKFFLEQNKESVNALEQSGLLRMSETELNVLRSIKNSKPFHSECMLFTPDLTVPVRVVIDRFMYYLFTTYMPDKLRIKQYTDAGLPIEQAIKKVIEDDNASGNAY